MKEDRCIDNYFMKNAKMKLHGRCFRDTDENSFLLPTAIRKHIKNPAVSWKDRR